MTSNTAKQSVVAIFDSHPAVQAALTALHEAGLDMRQVSVVAKDFYTEEQALGFYTSGDQIKFWGVRGRFWGSLWKMLSGGAFLFIPTVGPLVVMGPLAAAVVHVLEPDRSSSASGVLGEALSRVGLSSEAVSHHETAVNLGKFMVLAGGPPETLVRARKVLAASDAAELSINDS